MTGSNENRSRNNNGPLSRIGRAAGISCRSAAGLWLRGAAGSSARKPAERRLEAAVRLGVLAAAAAFVIPAALSLAAFSTEAAAAEEEFAFITTTDYSTGSSSEIRCDGAHTTRRDVASVHSDAVSRYYEGLIYVVNRAGGDNIQVLDPESDFTTLRQFSVGNGSNPQDIAFLSPSKAYVSRYDTNDLWIVNPATGDHTGTIDLSALADSDGLCEMDKMILLDGLLFISIQRVDRDNYWLPAGESYLAVVDCAADTLLDTDPETAGTQPVTLTAANPYSRIQLDPYTGNLYLSCVGSWGVADGGVEYVNPATFQSEGYMITESAAGGDICDVELFDEETGYAVISNASFNTDLISFDPSTGEKKEVIYSPGGYVINDIEISPGGELFLADQTATDPGVRIYSAWDGSAITTDPIDTGLPPYDICFSAAAQTDACPTPPAAALLPNYPNPFNPHTTIPFSMKEAGRASVTIYDASGRMVASIADGYFDAGLNRVTWNGTGRRGKPAPSGVYLVRLLAKGFSASRKMVLVR